MTKHTEKKLVQRQNTGKKLVADVKNITVTFFPDEYNDINLFGVADTVSEARSKVREFVGVAIPSRQRAVKLTSFNNMSKHLKQATEEQRARILDMLQE